MSPTKPDRNGAKLQAVAAEVVPRPGRATAAARALQEKGFRVFRVDQTISVDGPASLWTSIFGVEFELRRRTDRGAMLPQPEIQWYEANPSTIEISSDLQIEIEKIIFIAPPEFYNS